MNLPDAIRHARIELGLSQKKLSELSGVQRRQLATLESGGNVTLSTLRKVLAQLPNLESFTLDVVTVGVEAEPAEAFQARVREAMRLLVNTVQMVAENIMTKGVSEQELAAMRLWNTAWQREQTQSPEEKAQEEARIEEEQARLQEAIAKGDVNALLTAAAGAFETIEEFLPIIERLAANAVPETSDSEEPAEDAVADDDESGAAGS